MSEPRPIYEIAGDVKDNWSNVSPYAEPYLKAMLTLNSITNYYGQDSAKSIISYFLANAQGWRGPHARRIKAELKELIKNG
ncbi:hypothetical protein SEA_LITTLEFELLA_47 [Gordonia phage LittleFella]|nr:hypothetical protein SEA_LITTLEFELLA_47 [Gordonia phage LittleFella]